MSSSPISPQDPPNPSPLQPPLSSGTTTRRLPPPCWSHEETAALIDSYREKWYSLRRGNLRATHWQEVADALAGKGLLPPGIPQKTSVQCRHKMEKLRKRYRAELQRAAGRHGYNSSWVHFMRLDSMEKGTSSLVVPVNKTPIDEDDEEEDDEEGFQENFYPKTGKNGASHSRTLYGSMSNGIKGNGFRIRIPGRSNMVSPPPRAKSYSKSEEFSTPSPIPNPNFGNFKDGYNGRFGMGKSSGGSERVGKSAENDSVEEMVAAIKALGDSFMRIERKKMEMAREVEAMRMEMEVKRTEMILQSQQQIVESFTKAISERKNKKAKTMPSPEA